MAKAQKRKLEEGEEPKLEKEERKEEEEEEEVEEEEEDFEDEDEDDSEGSDSDDSEDDSDDEDSCPDVSDEDEDDDDSVEEGEDEKEINVEFSFCDPKEEDYLGLRTLLTNYHDGRIFDISGLVSTIIEQDLVGSVVKAAEDSDPIAVLTVLNTQTHDKKEFMTQTKDFLLAKCKPEYKEKIEKIFVEKGNGLLLSERLINCPPKIAPPLVQFLFDEIKNVIEDDEDDVEETVRESFRFDRYLLVSRVFMDPLGDDDKGEDAEAGDDKAAKPKAKKKKSAARKEPVLVYVRPEDEYLHQLSEWSCVFPAENRQAARDELQPMRLVMAVRADKVDEARRNLDSVVGNMAAAAGDNDDDDEEEEEEEEEAVPVTSAKDSGKGGKGGKAVAAASNNGERKGQKGGKGGRGGK